MSFTKQESILEFFSEDLGYIEVMIEEILRLRESRGETSTKN